MWEKPCRGNLSEALDYSFSSFGFHPELFSEKPNLYAKRLGVEHALCIDELIHLARNMDMTRRPDTRKHFIADLEWVRDLLNGNMSEIYRHAKNYIAQNDKGFASIIGSYLHQWAVDHKYAPAEFDVAQGYGSHDGKLWEWQLRRLAEKGYTPAIVDMARRYLSGDGVDKDLGEAWYWLKRAGQENVDTSSITQKPLNQLLEEMNEGERWSVTYFAHYYDDLDLSDVTIPPAFRPLSAKIPDPLSDQEVAAFVKKFKGLSRKTDNKIYNSMERELVTRTVGIRYIGNISIDGQIRPFGMEKDEFTRRKCNFHRAIGKIFPLGRDLIGEHLRRNELALSSMFDKSAARYVKDVLQGGRLCPNPKSKAISKALVWAKGLDQMSPAALRELAAIHIEKSESVSKTRYTPDPNNNLDNEFELFMHFTLAKTLRKFAEFKEQEK